MINKILSFHGDDWWAYQWYHQFLGHWLLHSYLLFLHLVNVSALALKTNSIHTADTLSVQFSFLKFNIVFLGLKFNIFFGSIVLWLWLVIFLKSLSPNENHIQWTHVFHEHIKPHCFFFSSFKEHYYHLSVSFLSV